MATKITPAMTAAVKKTFALKNAEGDAASRRFKVVGLIEALDFGAKGGGRQPAFVVHRLDKEGEHTPPAEQFLAAHVEVPEKTEAAPTAPTT